ncbi:MAG TPA: mechanosensitive ion channel family protein [Methylophaga aminisulfidivorans]|uniref:mechanosensitive ion channel family protein n=1 Tax=Methylophaga TaxID=40222 RepID=UPI00175E0913|nr:MULTISPECIES: mechanosensitive ion channel family protein [Methylophaga]HIC47779.1 mechanosensitive ion channel family protein [Methylophaga sp.]HIM40503.1 mechanosensitive ion channel family protein [Methylophaga aminisulfidivorans]
MNKIIIFCLLSLFAFNIEAGGVYPGAAAIGAQTNTSQVEQVEKSSDSDSVHLDSPRVAVQQFIHAMTRVSAGDNEMMSRAVDTLDLSEVSSLIRRERGQETARLLFTIIQLSDVPKLSSIPTHSKQDEYVYLRTDSGNIVLRQNEQKNWLFSTQTVDAIPDIFNALTDDKSLTNKSSSQVSLPASVQLRAEMPGFLKQGFLLEYWQWIGLFVVIVIGSIADKGLAWMLKLNVTRWKKKQGMFTHLDSNVLRPLGLMAMALMWWSGLNLLGLPDTALLILLVAVKLLVSISGIWSAFRIVDIFDAHWTSRAAKTTTKFDDLLVPMISKSLKVFVVVMGIVFAADNLNIDVTSLLAGLGLGGLAFALAAKDLLGNFFGSITVLLDRPFHIGDWVVIGDIEGMVEEVGFRSTRIRTFYNSLVTMPNSILTTTKIDNMGARRYRRMSTKLSVTYDTSPEKIEAFCEGIRKIIQMHPYMRKDYYQVYFNEYAADSLQILVYVFWATPDWNTELRERHRFLLDVLRLARQLEVEFAFPTQTLYLKKGDVEHPKPSAFRQGMSQQEAFTRGQQEAESIVSQTLGDEIPGPVEFPR